MRSIHFPLALCVVVISALGVSASAAEDDVQFNRDIRPILSTHCFACHGIDAKQRKAELRLDVADGASANREGSIAVVPGDLARSEVWTRITSDDREVVMPPPSTKKSLSAEQKALIRRWIEQGARYQQHWAFETPIEPAEPEVANAAWVRNPVDRFVLARLERDGLTPQPEADRETLIRRVAFALTGLPPSVAEVDAFTNDQSSSAYENMVDRYLASPHYGEEQARHWLDVARYADTHGLHLDNERQMWAYRDWVVKAFNDNLPFDEFSTWQLAGDLLPNPTLEQLVATGFNRCNVTTSEGGSIEPEWVYRYAVDRTTTMVQTWMGLTAGCAVCHDHKYDPLSMKEFYSLYAFFSSAADPGMDGNVRDTSPFLKAPTPEQAAALKEAESREAAARMQLEAATAQAEYRDPADAATAPSGSTGTSPRRMVSDMVVDDDFPLGAKVTNTSRNAAAWRLSPEFGAKSGRRVLELANAGEYDVTIQLALIPVVAPQNGALEFWLRVDPYYPPRVVAVQLDGGKGNRRAVWGDAASLPGRFPQWEMGPVPAAGDWLRLTVPLVELGLEPGTRIRALVLLQTGGRIWVDGLQVTGEIDPAADPLSSFQAWWRMSAGTNAGGVPPDVNAVLVAGPQKEHTPEQRQKLLRFYLQHVQRLSESPVAEPRAAWHDAEQAKVALDATIPGTFVFRELNTPRDAFVMLRGQYDKPGEKVEPGVPAVLPPLPPHDRSRHAPRDDSRTPLSVTPGGAVADSTNTSPTRATRLDLARWLLSPQHPLTARVAVNRIWQQFFGTGLVKTSDDFGTRGDEPSHPELLDWLAVHFRESGWNTKDLLRLLVTSATFRQRAVVTPELRRRDPENRLLAHGPRVRLDAEQLRDNALFVSGLINPRLGGRGVLPYQPPNIWEPVGYENSNTRFYMQDHGDALYRRSLYCFLKRTAPPPFMSNFDGPNREQFCSRRERSNTPLQALQLLNDVQHFEAARALAERTIAEGGQTVPDRLTFLYRTVLARRPTADEIALLKDAFTIQFGFFSADPESARQTVEVGESTPKGVAPAPETAAWTLIANLVLNLDETVMRN